ncbi:5-formyltetrahydrofolate cyclo-ligase [Rubrobacter xylanophilus DSM 9941]|uniref:5-formyltetrahydrofolate cyclo-ligase n=1 Tax=Rubrobacter xylanophilus (strain DSM 9941 / JCM 11954 / NBRC 16129 / PRD-1) TaxID=266117 RepID=Q1AWE3_RUBXD|nr:5-formyltetrahydrofolate cyclo-ligase [Rubrobacter xylanophilus]ABG04285.1 5-formyltetrahydrofolate cyclo-ligase [Rubrobacter xylanophilus DSM 9941]
MAARAGKAEIREEALRRREALGGVLRRRLGEEVLGRVLGLGEYRAAGVVLAYAGVGSELDTAGFMREVLGGGRRLVLPRVDREARRLELYEVEDPERELVPGVWGIPEPNPERARRVGLEEVEFVLVPGVAFDRRGGRLGHGAGYYDRLLGGARRLPPLVAAAFEAQIVERVPMEPHDVPVDLVVTERGVWRRERR